MKYEKGFGQFTFTVTHFIFAAVFQVFPLLPLCVLLQVQRKLCVTCYAVAWVEKAFKWCSGGK